MIDICSYWLFLQTSYNLVDQKDVLKYQGEDERWMELTDLHHQYERESALDVYMIEPSSFLSLVGSHPQHEG